MNHALIRSQMPTLVAGHVPRNARSFKFNIYDGTPQKTMLGFAADPNPFQGKVIAVTDDTIVVKVKPTQFAVVDRYLVTAVPAEGSKVEVIPYARRHFDGQRVGTPREKTEYLADGRPYTVKSVILGDATAELPVPQARCPELAELIQQLQKLPAPDGHRHISHLLVDANARDFSLVDPKPHDIIATPPAIRFTVETGKFSGQVTVSYDRGGDVYVVELHHGGESIERVDEVYFDDLGDTLERLIDDGSWRLIRVETLSGNARSVRH
ncbi:MAG: GTPase [Gammaproteobacteria bacterium HGW-Gammaproteobacteria-9]|nr:hypothetical protein [[Pseudomonas] sp. BICA1-14]KJS71938.1 MAG: GTPase [[Pseudomonas] sp. BICA1-14]PKM00859.1 MAG: GTPase [Gammaproteobacteria bacterium HGW-Gammaproteobacteria-9]